MSLINDALRRAKQQTTHATPGPNLQLRPMEEVPGQRPNSGILFTIIFASVLILAGAVVPMFLKDRKVHLVERSPVHLASTTPAIPAADAAAAPMIAEQVSTTSINTEEFPSITPVIPSAIAEAPAITPPPLKLNGIFFQTGKPSAIVNGKTVYVDGRVGEFRVASISAESVLLVSETQTNILAFGE
jgi:hypothetical protein